MPQVKVLLVQLASFGDCLLVTTIAKQIKTVDYPTCHLTWLIGSKYKQVIENNPFVDDFITVPISKVSEILNQRNLIFETINKLRKKSHFDFVFITDFIEQNYKYWFGTTRSSLFRCYPHPLVISPQPIIILSNKEKENVALFCKINEITDSTFNILFECSPQSGQSNLTFQNAKLISEQLIEQHKSLKIILTSNQSFNSTNSMLVDGSGISWKENAELANYCHLIVGCSSGISWLCTSNWTRILPFIQVINPDYMNGKISSSMKHDFIYFGLKTDNLLELYSPSTNKLKACIESAIKNSFDKVKMEFDYSHPQMFSSIKFLLSSKIPPFQRAYQLIIYAVPYKIYKLYRAIKPEWFTPAAWLRKGH